MPGSRSRSIRSRTRSRPRSVCRCRARAEPISRMRARPLVQLRRETAVMRARSRRTRRRAGSSMRAASRRPARRTLLEEGRHPLLPLVGRAQPRDPVGRERADLRRAASQTTARTSRFVSAERRRTAARRSSRQTPRDRRSEVLVRHRAWSTRPQVSRLPRVERLGRQEAGAVRGQRRGAR